MYFWVGVLVGIFVGANIGVLFVSLISIGKISDLQKENHKPKEQLREKQLRLD